MSTETTSADLRSPLAKARDEWLASEDGKLCLRQPVPHYGPHLENRLVMAFLAGAGWATNYLRIQEQTKPTTQGEPHA